MLKNFSRAFFLIASFIFLNANAFESQITIDKLINNSGVDYTVGKNGPTLSAHSTYPEPLPFNFPSNRAGRAHVEFYQASPIVHQRCGLLDINNFIYPYVNALAMSCINKIDVKESAVSQKIYTVTIS